MKRAGMALVVLGLLAMVFFLATDPMVMPRWTGEVGWGRNQAHVYNQRVDAAADAWWGTAIGVAGSAAIVVSGLWLLLRKSI